MSEQLSSMTISQLDALNLDELRDIARSMEISGYTRLKKYDLVIRLLRANAERQGFIFGGGILEIVQDGIGFLRSDHLLPGPEDVYVSQSQIRRFGLRTGDFVIGQVRPPKETEKYHGLLKVEAVNGLDPEEAKKRREEVSRESDFYGSMDGATKFVKGDAIAGILILAINIIGGLIIGMMKYNMPLGKAAQVYVTLTIGDGLVAQIPSLLLSLATAIIVTRDSSAHDLTDRLMLQMGNGRAWYPVAGIIALFSTDSHLVPF